LGGKENQIGKLSACLKLIILQTMRCSETRLEKPGAKDEMEKRTGRLWGTEGEKRMGVTCYPLQAQLHE